MTIEQTIIHIIANNLYIENEAEITPQSNIVRDLGADSLDVVEIFMEVEKEFHISIPDEEMEKIVTVKDAVDYITSVQKIEG